MKLSEYVEKRNGVPMGHSKSLRNNLQRALGAKNFSAFWNFWNPVFGYYLGGKVFKPLKKMLPSALAVVLTFIFSGLIHDLITTLVRGRLSLFFSVWFLLMGTAVAMSKRLDYDLSGQKWIFRACVNLSIISGCLFLTIYLNTLLKYY